MLRKSDLSPINFKRVAQADGKPVEWGDIVKGYEYEKGKFVILQDEDFKRVDIEATHSIDIVDFVELDEINPMHFSKPYYVEAGRGADRAYCAAPQRCSWRREKWALRRSSSVPGSIWRQ